MKRSDAETSGTSFDLDVTVENVPYAMRVTPFMFNGEKRFRISVNGSVDHIFVWDPEMLSLKALDDEGAVLPDDLVKAISEKLVRTQAL